MSKLTITQVPHLDNEAGAWVFGKDIVAVSMKTPDPETGYVFFTDINRNPIEKASAHVERMHAVAITFKRIFTGTDETKIIGVSGEVRPLRSEPGKPRGFVVKSPGDPDSTATVHDKISVTFSVMGRTPAIAERLSEQFDAIDARHGVVKPAAGWLATHGDIHLNDAAPAGNTLQTQLGGTSGVTGVHDARELAAQLARKGLTPLGEKESGLGELAKDAKKPDLPKKLPPK
ncbi:MAG: hypothetical protein EB060_04385 [Proteobacteria bacterium]|nr:hypothetical protein [Pseudomonadota bacterium]